MPALDLGSGSNLNRLQAAPINAPRQNGLTDPCGRNVRPFLPALSDCHWPHAGRKALTLYSVPPVDDAPNVSLLAGGAGSRRTPRPCAKPVNASGWNACAATLPCRDVGYLVASGQLRLHPPADRHESLVGRWSGAGDLPIQETFPGWTR
jgi:hypothetical protein